MAILDHHNPILKYLIAAPLLFCTLLSASNLELEPALVDKITSNSNGAHFSAHINPYTGDYVAKPLEPQALKSASDQTISEESTSATSQSSSEALGFQPRSNHPLVKVSFTAHQTISASGIDSDSEEKPLTTGVFNEGSFIQAPPMLRSHLIATRDPVTQRIKFSHAPHQHSGADHK